MSHHAPTDILENAIRESMPSILDILLIDRTASTAQKMKNIIWANDNYIHHNPKKYKPEDPITPDLITGEKGELIMPRVLKTQALKKERTKSRAEVFTPTWVVKKQNDEVDKAFKQDDLATYTKRKWLEITCGEAPYMATRYDMETGKPIALRRRVGFIDRKLKRINKEVSDKAEWQNLVEQAFQASYGFEWNGDSLLLARENLLYTYWDYYVDKWGDKPILSLFEEIATIISYNVFQMDGLKYIIPFSEKKKVINPRQTEMFGDLPAKEQEKKTGGTRVQIMNWSTRGMEYFDKGVKHAN